MIQNLTIPKLQRLSGQLREVIKAPFVIAGGAPRDILNNRPVKDIDVFIGLEPGDDSEMANEWYHICDEIWKLYRSKNDVGRHVIDLPWHEGDAKVPEVGWTNAKGYSYGAFTVVDFEDGPYCHALSLIFIDIDPVENVRNHFDFGLSKVWINSGGQLRMDPAYWHDHFGHRITYLNSTEPNEQRRASSQQRLLRLREKYAGWRFERCGGLIEAAPSCLEKLPEVSSDCQYGPVTPIDPKVWMTGSWQ